VLTFLRFAGLLNASIWMGAAVFFTLGAGPAFFSDDMASILPKSHAGAAAQIVLQRYLWFHLVCGLIALIHLLVEWLYSGRPLSLFSTGLVSGMLVVSAAGAFGLLPKMGKLHRQIYSPQNTTEEIAAARRSFGLWHGVSQAANLGLLGGILVHLWTTSKDPKARRFFL